MSLVINIRIERSEVGRRYESKVTTQYDTSSVLGSREDTVHLNEYDNLKDAVELSARSFLESWYVTDTKKVAMSNERFVQKTMRDIVFNDAVSGDVVYFVQSECPIGYIKIGTTTNLKNRLSALNQGFPFRVKLLFSVNGCRNEEMVFHARFREYRVNCEWFLPKGNLLDFINDVMNSRDVLPQDE